jgi:hypothetical protein
LYEYVDTVWDKAKADGFDPATLPEWSVVAGLRDLTGALIEQVQQAQADAGEQTW